MSTPTFNSTGATDPSYIINFAQEKIDEHNASKQDARSHTKLHKTESLGEETHYGIVTLMDIYGDYVTPRKGALRVWTMFKLARKVDEPKFWVQHKMTERLTMDFCTITDFIEHVMPLVAGELADVINQAHGRPCAILPKEAPVEEATPGGFDKTQAADVPYCERFCVEQATTKGIELRTEEQGGQTAYSIVDLMQAVGAYKDRGSVKSSWGHHRKEVTTRPGFTMFRGGRAGKMEFCSMVDFLDHVLPHVSGPVAKVMKQSRAVEAASRPSGSEGVVSEEGENKDIDSESSMADQQATSASPSAAGSEGSSGTPSARKTSDFDGTRASDLAYCIRFFEEQAELKGISIRTEVHEGQTMYSVVDLSTCVGDYKDRRSAKDSWKVLRVEVAESFPLFRGANRMDFVPFTDFLDHVLPHITGAVAAAIKFARSKVATAALMQPPTTSPNGAPVSREEESVRSVAVPMQEQAVVNTVTDAGAFDPTRAADLAYCVHFFEQLARSKGLAVRTVQNDGQTTYAVVDLAVCVGDYENRQSAKMAWHHYREATVTTCYVRKGPKNMDFISLTDFLDHVLPHVTGALASSIKLARSKVATAVGVGSSLAVALTEAHAESAEKAPEHIRKIVDEVRNETEESLLASGVSFRSGPSQIAPPGRITVDDIEVNIINEPPGTFCYRRRSVGHYIPDFTPPPGAKLQTDAEKLGLTDDVSRRDKQYQFRKDGGVFDVLVKIHSYMDVGTVERMQKAAIWKHRMYSSDEYFSLSSYRHQVHLAEDEEPYMHMLQHFVEYIEKVYVAEVTLEEISQEDDGQTTMDQFVTTAGKGKGVAVGKIKPRYRLNVEYKEMPDWEKFSKKPLVVRQSSVQVAKANLKTVVAQKETEAIKLDQEVQRTCQAKEKTAQEQEKTRQEAMALMAQGKITFEQALALITACPVSCIGPIEAEQVTPDPPETPVEPAAPETPADQDDSASAVDAEQQSRFATFYAERCILHPDDPSSTVASMLVTAAFRVWMKVTHDRQNTLSDNTELKKFMLARHKEVTAWEPNVGNNQLSYQGVTVRPMEYLPLSDPDFDAFVRDRCSVGYQAKTPSSVFIDAYTQWREDRKMAKMPPTKLSKTVEKCMSSRFPRNTGYFNYQGQKVSGGYTGLRLKETAERLQNVGEPSEKTYRKQVEKVDVRTGEVVEVYKSASECNVALGRRGACYVPRGEVDGFTYRFAQ